MSPRSAAPITDDVIAAIAKFFHGGAGVESPIVV